MTKKEIEKKIFDDVEGVMQEIGGIPFDKAFPIMQQKVWVIADKYDTDGHNVMNIYFTLKGKKKDD